MTSTTPLRTVRSEASDWVVRLRSENATAEDRKQFEAWADADPRHRGAYDRLASTWQRLSLLSAANDRRSASGPKNLRRWGLAAAAAGAALIVGSAAFFVLREPHSSFATGVGEQRTVVLPDTSIIELNTDSHVAVDFKADQRRIVLERGEARFKAARDPGRPFIVEAAGSFIRAVGTEFNVRIKDREVEVVVVEGAVRFSSAQGAAEVPALIRAGESVGSGRPQAVAALTGDALERKLAWQEGMVSFQGETLREVLAELGRYNPIEWELGDQAAANLRVSGYFRATDVPTFFARLEANFPVEVRRDGRKTIIATRASDGPSEKLR